jgi:hypothetical protein
MHQVVAQTAMTSTGIGSENTVWTSDAVHLQDLDIGPCKQLQDLCVPGNQLTSLRGVHQCSAISSIDVSNNLLTSLEGLKGARSLDVRAEQQCWQTLLCGSLHNPGV